MWNEQLMRQQASRREGELLRAFVAQRMKVPRGRCGIIDVQDRRATVDLMDSRAISRVHIGFCLSYGTY